MKKCYYCEGNCPNEPKNSEFLCDGYAGDIDNLYVKKSISKKIEGNNMTKKDKLKKYIVMASQTQIAQYEIEVKAKNEEDAEKIALETDINDWCDYDTWNQDALSVDEIKEVKND